MYIHKIILALFSIKNYWEDQMLLKHFVNLGYINAGFNIFSIIYKDLLRKKEAKGHLGVNIYKTVSSRDKNTWKYCLQTLCLIICLSSPLGPISVCLELQYLLYALGFNFWVFNYIDLANNSVFLKLAFDLSLLAYNNNNSSSNNNSMYIALKYSQNILRMSLLLLTAKLLESYYYYPDFIDVETEAERE